MTVEMYPVEGRKVPLVLGVIEGDGDGPGVLFDGHFDTVHAVASDWSHDPWDPVVEDGVLYGRGAVDSKGTMVAMLMAAKAVVDSGEPRSGPIYFMSDSDGEDGFRGAALMADLGVIDRVGTMWSAEATSNEGVEIAYPGISTWKITAIGKTAHPTEPEHGHQRGDEDGEAGRGGRPGPAELPKGDSQWFEPRVTTNGDPHPPRRRLGDPGPLRRGALGPLAPRRRAERSPRRDRRLPAHARAGGRRGPLRAQDPADGRRPPLAAPGRSRPRAPRRQGARGGDPRARHARTRWSASSTAAGSTRSS